VSGFRLNKLLWFYCLLLALTGFLLSGCASTEPENESVRPWNAPIGWENGLPAGMTEGR
jgi:hypothetical protein